MKVSLFTDAKKHNLALMKISTFHKRKGDQVLLNAVDAKFDLSYGSWMFEDSRRRPVDVEGGIGYAPGVTLPKEIEDCRPDYSLFNLNHSLGYTFRACFRKCPFCKVPLLKQTRRHWSIYEFHDPRFDTIELLNNNTFYDVFWEETFKEIYNEGLGLIDHGNDLRLLDNYKAYWIKKIRWERQPKFAWDRMRDEWKMKRGLQLLKKFKIRAMIYVLMGFDTSFEEDVYRCEIINSMGCDPFPMLYNQKRILRLFRRMIYLRYYRSYSSIKEAWCNYKKSLNTASI